MELDNDSIVFTEVPSSTRGSQWYQSLLHSGTQSEHNQHDAAKRATTRAATPPADVQRSERAVSKSGALHSDGDDTTIAFQEAPPSPMQQPRLRSQSLDSDARRRSQQQSDAREQRPSAATRLTMSDEAMNRMYYGAVDRQLAQRQWACKERARREEVEAARNPCTFTPALSQFAKSIRRPQELSPENRAAGEWRRKLERLESMRLRQMKDELAECTFKPLTLSAAKLHASALIERSHLHSKLFHQHEAAQHFRQQLALEAAKQLEEKMVHPKHAPTLTTEEVNDVVVRLLRNHEDVEAALKQQQLMQEQDMFHPRLNRHSERIVMDKRKNNNQDGDSGDDGDAAAPQDVVERLLRQSKRPPQFVPPSPPREVRPSSSSARDPRRKTLEHLYVRLAQQAVESIRRQNEAGGTKGPSDGSDEKKRQSAASPPSLTPEVVQQLSLQGTALAKAALDLLPLREAEELLDLFMHAEADDAFSQERFVKAALDHIRREGPKRYARPEPRFSSPYRELLEENKPRPVPHINQRSKELAAKHAVAGSVVDRLEKQRKLAEERHLAAVQETADRRLTEALKECTFAPKCNTEYHPPRGAPFGRSGEQKSYAQPQQRASTPPLASRSSHHQQQPRHQHHRMASHDSSNSSTRPAALPAEVQHAPPLPSQPRSHTTQHHVLVHDDAPTMMPRSFSSSSSPAVSPSKQQRPPPRQSSATSTTTTAAAARKLPSNYRDVISEHAAFGPAGALAKYGAELMRRQLGEADATQGRGGAWF